MFASKDNEENAKYENLTAARELFDYMKDYDFMH